MTHFVRPETPLDVEASVRCTTVYLVDKRIDMLPALLGTSMHRLDIARAPSIVLYSNNLSHDHRFVFVEIER